MHYLDVFTISILMNIGSNVVIHWEMLQTFLEPRVIISSGKVPKGGIAGVHLYCLHQKENQSVFSLLSGTGHCSSL